MHRLSVSKDMERNGYAAWKRYFQGSDESNGDIETQTLVIRYVDLLSSKNVDVVGSSEYLDFMIDQGAAFVWYFTYMPVGNDAVPELMVTSEQRKFITSKYVCSVRQSRSLLWILE